MIGVVKRNEVGLEVGGSARIEAAVDPLASLRHAEKADFFNPEVQ
jgi:hypothetical protein